MAQNSAPRPNNHARALDQQRVPDQVAAGRGEYTIGGQEQSAFRQRMPSEVQQRDRPREASQVRQAALPEEQSSAEQRDRDRRILGRGEAQQAAPVFLLECVEHGQDRAEHADSNDKDTETRAVQLQARQPVQQAAAQAEIRGVQHDTGHDRAGRAAAGAVGAREPFVERQQAELCPKSDDEQHADGGRHADQHAGMGEVCEAEALDRVCHDDDRHQQGHRTDFEHGEHEQYRTARTVRETFTQDHHRAAQAHSSQARRKKPPC